MNHYTEILNYIKEIGEQDVFVNTVTQGEFDKIDLNKFNVFPLLHASINGANFTNGSSVTFNIQLGCFNIRDKNKEINTDKYFNNDNEVDNLNETLAVLNRTWKIMYKDFNDKGFYASENPTLEPRILDYSNLLDGWILDFEVEMPNNIISLCQ